MLQNTDTSFITSHISKAGTLTLTTTVTDSRGRTGTATKTIEVLEYSKPKITALTAYRSDAAGVSNTSGAYLTVKFSASIDDMSVLNDAYYLLKYKKRTETEYCDLIQLIDYDGEYTVTNALYTFPADTGTSYNITLYACDYMHEIPKEINGAALKKLFSFFKKTFGFAFGKVVERENAVEFALNLYDKFDTVIGNGLAEYTGSGDSAIDFNTTLEHVVLSNKNTPTTAFWYVLTFFYNGKTDSGNKAQIAIPYRYAGMVHNRFKFDGEWSDWSCDHPVGSYYISHDDTSPAELFGGTWHRIESRFLWGAPSTSTLGLTAGEMTHTLTVAEMPSHRHVMNGLETDRVEGGYRKEVKSYVCRIY